MIRNFDKETNEKEYIIWKVIINFKKGNFIYEKRFYNSNYKNIKLE